MAQVPGAVLDYLAAEKTATLGTASADGTPHARTFMYANDGLALYFWARPTSITAAHLRSNPRISFAIDEYVEDWNKTKGLQGEGRCELVSGGDELAKAIGLFADKFPSSSSGASTTNISFFKVTPTSLQFIDNSGARIDVSSDEFGIDFHSEEVLGDSG